jgi:hypothetical protein
MKATMGFIVVLGFVLARVFVVVASALGIIVCVQMLWSIIRDPKQVTQPSIPTRRIVA